MRLDLEISKSAVFLVERTSKRPEEMLQMIFVYIFAM